MYMASESLGQPQHIQDFIDSVTMAGLEECFLKGKPLTMINLSIYPDSKRKVPKLNYNQHHTAEENTLSSIKPARG